MLRLPGAWAACQTARHCGAYPDQLIDEQGHFTFLGRAKPLELEKIYIALKVGEYVPPEREPG